MFPQKLGRNQWHSNFSHRHRAVVACYNKIMGQCECCLHPPGSPAIRVPPRQHGHLPDLKVFCLINTPGSWKSSIWSNVFFHLDFNTQKMEVVTSPWLVVSLLLSTIIVQTVSVHCPFVSFNSNICLRFQFHICTWHILLIISLCST